MEWKQTQLKQKTAVKKITAKTIPEIQTSDVTIGNNKLLILKKSNVPSHPNVHENPNKIKADA